MSPQLILTIFFSFSHFFLVLVLFVCLFYILNMASAIFLSWSPPSVVSPSTPQTFLLLSASWNGQVSHEYKQNITYQVAVRQSNLPCIKAGQGNPVWEVGSQKPIKESETAPVPSVRSTTRGPSYTTVTCAEGLGQSRADSLVVGSVFVSSYDPRLVDICEFSCDVLDPSGSYNLSLQQNSPSLA